MLLPNVLRDYLEFNYTHNHETAMEREWRPLMISPLGNYRTELNIIYLVYLVEREQFSLSYLTLDN